MTINTRQKEFARKFGVEMMPASRAYAAVYGGDPADNSTQVKASQLLRNPKVKQELADISELAKVHSEEAFHTVVEIMRKKSTPPSERLKAAKDVMDRGGFNATQKIETKEIPSFPGITDMTREELLEMLSPASAPEPSNITNLDNEKFNS